MTWRHDGASIAERFWEKVHKTDNCWLWVASIRPHDGYGSFRISKEIGNDVAHRFSWELHNGSIPEGLFVCHKCDTPACVRPDHLFLGTAAENSADSVSKSRQAFGERQGGSKLTDEKVRQIMMLWDKGLTQREIADHFGVEQTNISVIVTRKSWRHIEWPDYCSSTL